MEEATYQTEVQKMKREHIRTGIRQTNEDYGAFDLKTGLGGNLTPLQRRYAYWWDAVRPYQVGRQEMGHAVFGFKGRREKDGRVNPLSPDEPIRDLDTVCLLSVVPIRKEAYLPQAQIHHGRYRLHFAEQVVWVDDGQVVAGGKFLGKKRVDPVEHRQVGLEKRPIQNHQVYAQREYSPSGLGEMMVEAAGNESEAAMLKTPVYGNFAVVRDDLHLRLTIEGYDVYRFELKHQDAVELVAEPGEVVQGAVLAKLVGPVEYLMAEPWASKPDSKATKPVIDRIQGDVLSATTFEPQLKFGVTALETMLAADKGNLELMLGEDEARPRPMVEISHATLANARELGWEPNVDFRTALRLAVSPNALRSVDSAEEDRAKAWKNVFCVKAPCDGTYLRTEVHTGYKLLVIEDARGKDHVTLPLPGCAEISDELGEVKKGEPVGEYCPRVFCKDYAEFEALTDGYTAAIEEAFLDFLCVHSGQLNWSGNGVLLDARYAGALREHATGWKLNFDGLGEFIDDEFGLLIFPPHKQDLRTEGFERQVHGIRYVTAPVGPRFGDIQQKLRDWAGSSDSTSRPKKRRNRRRKKAAKAEN